ncbi:hypothetical protein [Natronoarchaeum rubrum]|uniref:hypothetical protein n=1 Tax=Natronoarchaeum rubrum TaxID=755311 RepID=UPI0021135667|nr:hypothetical protein [Natronoarchaeum rubrum]
MAEETENDGEDVSISVEINGNYDDVVTKLRSPDGRSGVTESIADDLDVLLETIVEMNGGTRSAIAERLPAEMAVEYDAEAVVEALQVLARYDLVVLEDNTWKPGPELPV